jgi:hypothetical protein
MNRLVRALATLAIVCAFAPVAVRADAPSVGVTVNGIVGTYNTGGGNTSVPVVPLPLFSLRIPVKRFAVLFEGVPPIGPIGYDDGRGGTQATKMSYASAEARYSFHDGRYALGIGETLLNQMTFYSLPQSVVQSSRVVGLRVSGIIRLSSGLTDRTELSLAASPRMHAVQRTAITAGTICGLPPFGRPGPPAQCSPLVFGANDPEVASLVDAKLTREHAMGRYTLSYGLRYLNYFAHYPINDHIADHDRFIMPFVGFAAKLGH